MPPSCIAASPEGPDAFSLRCDVSDLAAADWARAWCNGLRDRLEARGASEAPEAGRRLTPSPRSGAPRAVMIGRSYTDNRVNNATSHAGNNHFRPLRRETSHRLGEK